jgi:cellulose biosynthesis protein BcsQ
MDQYDYVFLDCAPSISLVSENVFQAADALLVPTIPTTLSLRTLEQLEKFRRKELLTKLIVLPFFSMVDRRKQLHRDILAQAPHQLGMIESFIPYASEVERMGVERAVLASFAGNSRAAQAYRQLWAEIQVRIG